MVFHFNMTDLINEYYTSVDKNYLARQYHEWVCKQPCAISGSMSIAKPHHIRLAGYCGIGMKPPDIFEMPITYELHYEIHTFGVKTFQKKYKVDFDEILIKLHTSFQRENKLG